MKKLLVVVLALMLAMGIAMAETAPAVVAEPVAETVAETTAAVELTVAATVEPEPTEEPIVYLLPESDIRLITAEELADVDLETLGYMRNEILARHGYPFVKEHYQEYFRAQVWYVENPEFDYNMLSEIEMENVETIKKLEAELAK